MLLISPVVRLGYLNIASLVYIGKWVYQSVLWTDWQPGMCSDSDEDWKGDCHHIRKLPVVYNEKDTQGKATSWPNPEPFHLPYNCPLYHPLWQVLPVVPLCPKVFQLTSGYIQHVHTKLLISDIWVVVLPQIWHLIYWTSVTESYQSVDWRGW